MSSTPATSTKPYALGRNAFFLLLAKGAYILASFLLYVILVRIFDRRQINTFGLAITFNNLFVIAADFGVTQLSVRSSAQAEREEIWSIFLGGLGAKVLYAAIGSALMALVVTLLYDDPFMRTAIFIACGAALLRSFSEYIEGIATGVGRSNVVAGFTFVQYLALFAACWYAAAIQGWGVHGVLWCYVAVMAGALLMRLGWIFTHARRHSDASARIRGVLREAPAFGVGDVALVCMNSTYVIVISRIDSVSNELAVFQGAQKFIGLVVALGAPVARSFYAAASNAFANKDRDSLSRQMSQAMHLLAILSFWACIVFLVSGKSIGALFYSDRLANLHEPLAIMAIGMPLFTMMRIPGQLLPAYGFQAWKTILVVGGTGLTICSTCFATVKWGIIGTAGAFAFNETLLTGVMLAAQSKLTGYFPRLSELFKTAIAALVFVVFLALFKRSTPQIMILGIGSVVYGIAIILLEVDKRAFPGFRPWLRRCWRVAN